MAKNRNVVEEVKTESMKITWCPGFRMASVCDAATAYEEFESIRKDLGLEHDKLPASALVDAVEASPKSPLRPFFEWDNNVAGRQWRVHQARNLIKAIQVYRPEINATGRVYELDTSGPKDEPRAYRPTEDIMADPDARAQLLKRALFELVAIQRKYRKLQELAIVMRTIDEVLESVKV